MAGLATARETIAWVLQLQGDLGASAETTATKVEKLGLSAAETKAKVKELDAAQKTASAESAAWTKNLLGVAGVVSSVAIGLGIATSAAQKWVAATLDANKHIRMLGESTGAAGVKIDNYATSLDGLGLAFDRVLLKFSSDGIGRLTQVANVLQKIAIWSGSGDSPGLISASDAFGVSTLGVSKLVEAGLDKYGGTPFPTSGGWNPMAQLDGLTAPGAPRPGLGASLLYPLAPPPPKPVTGSRPSTSSSPVVPVDLNALRMGMASGHSVTSDSPWGSTTALAEAIRENTGALVQNTTRLSGQTGAGIAGGLGAISGGLPSMLALGGPWGAAAGAAVGLAPNLGKTWDSITRSESKLPDQIVRGLEHVLQKMPEYYAQTLPDIILAIAQSLPELLGTYFRSVYYELPKAIGQAVAEAIRDLLPGGDGKGWHPFQGKDGKQTRSTGSPSSGAARSSRSGQQDRVTINVNGGNTHDVIRRIRKELGSYGSGESLDALVTS